MSTLIKIIPVLYLFTVPLLSQAQDDSVITVEETSRIIHILASDSLEGRGNGQPGVLMAAKFIGEEFRKIGLATFKNNPGYYFPFFPDRRKKKGFRPPVSVIAPLDSIGPQLLYNVVGVLPGRTKSKEFVVFSAHYDHWGIQGKKKDNILNGANDNASGTTAVLQLAKYFAARNDNERTLIFCAFAGEELGLKGSAHFIQYLQDDLIAANVNIEMIGVPQFGPKSVFITGAENSTFAAIISKNTAPGELKLVPDPDPDKDLYKRSDNYIFVRAGVVGHSIMASSDEDKCYHEFCDEVERIDIPNMTAIIRAIAKATATMVSGEETPVRK